ncbi:MAG: hypothetical protein K8I27_12845 [Planctomycetes bacterium]|nr:hypothetical protein [Planctomycetota bacterium]
MEFSVGTGEIFVDRAEVESWAVKHPQPYNRDEYLRMYQDVHGTPDEDKNAYIQRHERWRERQLVRAYLPVAAL